MGPWWAQYKQGWKDSIHLASHFGEYQQAGKPDVVGASKERKVLALPQPPKCKVHISKHLLSICMGPWWAQYKQGWKESIPRALPSIQPHIMPERDIWAQPPVMVADSWTEEHLPRSQQEFAVLEFAHNHVVTVKVDLKAHMPCNQQQFAVLKFVNKEACKIENLDDMDDFEHVDLADDSDWDIAEPIQVLHLDDEDEDDDDEWLQVDDPYASSVLEGMCVLDVNDGIAGHALTPEGRVIELNGGGPVAFSCEAEHSSGHIRKVAAISMAKASADARLAKAASDVDAEIVRSCDAAGTVRGGTAVHATADQTKTARLKLFQKKRKQARRMVPTRAAISVNACGHVFLFSVKKPRHVVRVQVSNTPTSVTGVVRDIIETCDVRRGMHIDPDAVLIVDANGVIQTHEDPFAVCDCRARSVISKTRCAHCTDIICK